MMVQSRIPNHPVNFISHISRRCFSSDTSTVDANSPPSPPLPHFSDLASAVEDVGEQDEHVELLIGDFEIGSASQDENNEFYNNDDLAISDIDSDTEVSVDASVDEDVAEIVEIGGEIEVAVAAATTITIPYPPPLPPPKPPPPPPPTPPHPPTPPPPHHTTPHLTTPHHTTPH